MEKGCKTQTGKMICAVKPVVMAGRENAFILTILM